MKGLKYDSDKPMMSLIDPEWVLGTGRVLTKGAKKYAPNNWKNVDRTHYEDAIFRHLMAYLSGEKIDPESGESHLYHINCNSMFLDYFDRYSRLKGYSNPTTFYDEYYGVYFKDEMPTLQKIKPMGGGEIMLISTPLRNLEVGVTNPKTSRSNRTKRHK